MQQDTLKEGKKAAILAASIVILFSLAKFAIGFLSGSIVLLAAAVHGIADSFSTLAIWVGLKISGKSPTKKFAYGYYKAESVTALIVSALILYAGYEIVARSYAKIFTTYQLKFPLLAIGIALLDGLIIFFVGRYEIKVGKKINSQSLVADGKESQLHIFFSSMVLVGLFSTYFGLGYIEALAGIIIALFIFKVGLGSLKDSVYALMDVSPSKKVEAGVRKILSSTEGVESFRDLRLRKSGPFIFGEVSIKIKKFVDVARAHEIADKIEARTQKLIPQISSLVIHVEPFKSIKQVVVIPVSQCKGMSSQISDHFGRAEFYIFVTLERGKVKSHKFKINPFKTREIRAGLAAADWIAQEKPDVLITKEMGAISLHALRDNLIEVYKTEAGSVKEIIKQFKEFRLERLEEPTRKK